MSQNFEETTLGEYIQMHIEWSGKTFGEGSHTEGLLKHIEKEVAEVREAYYQGTTEQISQQQFNQEAAKEFVDIIILSIDAMWRQGLSADQIAHLLCTKQQINFERVYPAITNQDEPTEHIHIFCRNCGHDKEKHDGTLGCMEGLLRHAIDGSSLMCECKNFEEEI